MSREHVALPLLLDVVATCLCGVSRLCADRRNHQRLSQQNSLEHPFLHQSCHCHMDPQHHVCWQVRNELEGLTFKAADGSLYPGSSLIPVGLQNTLSVEGNVLILLAFTIGTRVLAFAMTEAAARLRFL